MEIDQGEETEWRWRGKIENGGEIGEGNDGR